MTDRIDRLNVVLEQDTRDDDVEFIVDAICMIRGVASVGKHVVDGRDYSARMRVRHEVARDLHAVYEKVRDGR